MFIKLGWGNHVCMLSIIMKMMTLQKMKYFMRKEILTVKISPKLMMPQTCNYNLYCKNPLKNICVFQIYRHIDYSMLTPFVI